jgi:hypothetical protein
MQLQKWRGCRLTFRRIITTKTNLLTNEKKDSMPLNQDLKSPILKTTTWRLFRTVSQAQAYQTLRFPRLKWNWAFTKTEKTRWKPKSRLKTTWARSTKDASRSSAKQVQTGNRSTILQQQLDPRSQRKTLDLNVTRHAKARVLTRQTF